VTDRPRAGDWIATNSGIRYWPTDPYPEDVVIEDIAHHLSLLCRFGGAVDLFYSVAQHSVYCAAHVPEDLALEGLLHDATEAYLGDMVRPLKQGSELGRLYRSVEQLNRWAIAKRFGLKQIEPAEVKVVDDRLLVTEARDLGERLRPDQWAVWGTVVPYSWKVEPVSPAAAERAFLRCYEEIGGRYA
jgi:hypothetical protein